MKVRIGFAPGARAGADAGRFLELVDGLEDLGFDSLWLSERVSGDAPDPIIGLSVAAGRTKRLKLGTGIQVLPGRNPALLAQSLASLDVLSNGRFLPGFGLGAVDRAEQQAFGVAREERAPWFDEVIPLLQRIWSEESVDHDGERFHYESLRVRPQPVQQPLEIWFGGKAPSELRRVGRLGDGWLASFAMPDDCASGRPIVEAEASAFGRAIDPEHFGAMVFYTDSTMPDAVAEIISKRNPSLDPHDLVPAGLSNLRKRCSEFIEIGFSKLVVVPMDAAREKDGNSLTQLADSLLDLQT